MPSILSNEGQKLIQFRGVILVLIGLFFILRRESQLLRGDWNSKESWGAILLGLASYRVFSTLKDYRNSSNGKEIRGPMIRGLILGIVGSLLLLNLEWSQIWPSFLILAGLSRFVGGSK